MIKFPFLLPATMLAAPVAAQTAISYPAVCGDIPVENCDVDFGVPAIPGDIVVTAARAAQPADQVGQAVTRIDRAEIERRQTVSVADLLATTPGVTVTRNGSLGGFTGVRIRGAEAEQTLVVIDGVRVNDPSSPGGGFDFANLLSSSVERIEVLRGPDSVPWGSQAIGGIVNIVTAAPTEGLQARGRAEYGYHDSVFASGGVSGRHGAVSGALNGGYLDTDGISAAAAGTERDGYRQYGGSGRLGIDLAPGIGLDFGGYYADSRADLDGFPAPRFVLADTPEYSTAQELYGYAGLHANLADGRFANRIAFTIADINRDNFDAPGATAPAFFGRGRSERYEYQGDLRVIDQVRIVAGAEHEDSRFVADADRHASGTTSVYGQAIVRPIDVLTVTGGVRHDDNDDFGGHTTAAVNGALALTTGTILRASYAEGFKAPTLYQRFASFYGTPSLRPETARNYDGGIEQSFLGGHGSAAVTYFNRRTKDQIDFDLGTFTYANIARTKAEGVEIAVAVKPVEALTFTVSYSYIDSRNALTGRDLARRPHETVSANVDYRFPFGLTVGGTVTSVGDSFDDPANTARLDGYALASVRAELPVGERLAIYGRVDNVGDERYQTVRGYGTYGRAAYGGVRVKFD